MGRKKAAVNVDIRPWLSAKQDCKEGRFIQVGNSLLFSKAAQSLSAGSFRLYLCMAMESGGRSEFSFPNSAAKKYGFAETSFNRYTKELREKGFIIVTECGRITRTPNIYRFSFSWKGLN